VSWKINKNRRAVSNFLVLEEIECGGLVSDDSPACPGELEEMAGKGYS
jgi:hypothetical protein